MPASYRQLLVRPAATLMWGDYRGSRRAEDMRPPEHRPSGSWGHDCAKHHCGARPITDVQQDDVRDLLIALGLGDHARPESLHCIVQEEIIPAIRRLREG